MSVRGVAAAGGGGGGGPAISAGTQSVSTGTVIFSNSNNVSFGMAGSNTVTASYAPLGIVSLSGGAGTSNSNVTGLTFANSNGMTFGVSTGAQVATVTGSYTVPATTRQNSFYDPVGYIVGGSATIGNGTLTVFPCFNPPACGFTASQADLYVSISNSSNAASSYAGALSLNMALYTLNGSTLSLASSGSQSYQWSDLSGGSQSLIAGPRLASVPFNVNYTGGQDIWAAVLVNTTSTLNNWFTVSHLFVALGTGLSAGNMLVSSNTSYQLRVGMGVYTVSTAALPGSIGLNQLSVGVAVLGSRAPIINFINFSS